VPRKISLGPEGPKAPLETVDDKDLTPEQLLAKKLADLQKKTGPTS
jgi:hypothetical protein